MPVAWKRRTCLGTVSLLDLSDRPELRPLADLIGAVRACTGGLEVLLVGATARDLLLRHAHGLDTTRTTRDVDIAFAVADWDGYADLRRCLLTSGDFFDDKSVRHRLLFQGQQAVDLVPFGGVERADRTIAWPPNEDSVMNVLGFREALSSAVMARLPGGQEVAVVSLPALAILKLMARQDRGYLAPGKDAGDLWLLLRHYAEAGNHDRLYGDFGAILAVCGFDLGRAGAWLLGRDARTVLQAGGAGQGALAAVGAIVEPEIDGEGPLRLVGEMPPSDRERQLALLRAFHAGFTGHEPRQENG